MVIQIVFKFHYLLGSFMFIAIEGDEAIEQWQNITKQRKGVASKLWGLTCELNIFDEALYINA